MKQVWECGFCSYTGTKEDTRKHEANCAFNPNQRGCYTCKSCYEDSAPVFGFWNSCEKGLSCFDVIEDDIKCVEWEPIPQEIPEGVLTWRMRMAQN